MSPRRSHLHPAVRGFERAAETYERGRPDYPRAAVRCLVRELGLGPRRTVVELGSGTGKLTRALRPTGAAVVAVEPTPGMRRVFERELPSVAVLDGVAEAIPLPDAFADAVVSAQAFHWFRGGPALREIARVLRPGGGLGLLWNVREEPFPFTRRLSAVIDRYGGTAPHYREKRWMAAFARRPRRFAPLRQRSFRHHQLATPAAVVRRVLSISFVAALPLREQRAVGREVRAILAGDPATAGRAVVDLPYRTDVYVTHRRGNSP